MALTITLLYRARHTAGTAQFMIMQAFTAFMTDIENVNWEFPRVKSRIVDHAFYAHHE
jgi:hypothetical protein